MFGRRIALSFVKTPRRSETNPDGPIFDELMPIDEIAHLTRDTIVDTAAGLATVLVYTASALAIIRMSEHVVKNIFR